jgi:acyl-CoA thioester hydrolase
MRPFSRRFRVRHYELDSFGHVNNAVYVNHMQEAAIEASTDGGFGPAWYSENGARWVIRQLSIRYYLPAEYGDELEVTTWVSQVRRVTTTREYAIARVSDAARVARARVTWVYLDRDTSQPKRLPSQFATVMEPTDEVEELGIRLQKPRATEDAFRYRTTRRVQSYELDTSQHVNHAVYLNWIEQAYFDALRSAGHPVQQTREEGWLALQGGHEIQYFHPAVDADQIEIHSWICEMGKVRGAWTHEIYCTNRNVLLAREYSLGIFVNGAGRLVSAPKHIVEDVLRGNV